MSVTTERDPKCRACIGSVSLCLSAISRGLRRMALRAKIFPESLSVISRDLVTFGKSCDDDESSPLPVSWRGLAAHAEQVVDVSRPGTEPVLCGAHLRVQSVGCLGSYGW